MKKVSVKLCANIFFLILISIITSCTGKKEHKNKKFVIYEKRFNNTYNVRQTFASIDSYTIEWDKVKNADYYNIYKLVKKKNKVVLDTFVNEPCISEKIKNRNGFNGRRYDGQSLRLYIKPVINGVEDTGNYYIIPIFYERNELIIEDYIDPFDNLNISLLYQFTYWHGKYKYFNKTFKDGGQVIERDGSLKMEIKTTNNGPALNFLCKRGENDIIKISFDAFVHKANNNHYLRLLTPYTITGMYHHKHSNKYGIWSYDRNGDYKTDFINYGYTEIYDEWMKVSYQMNYRLNTIDVSFGDDDYSIPFDFSTVESDILQFSISNYGWNTDHYIKIDNLSVDYYPITRDE